MSRASCQICFAQEGSDLDMCAAVAVAVPFPEAAGWTGAVWLFANLKSFGGNKLLILGERKGRVLPTATQSMFI